MRSSRIRLWAMLWLLPALALAQPAGTELNVISKVNVQGGTIEIVGSRKPSFTTFTMTDPPRLVIDVSEAVFSGVPDEMQVGNGTVTAVKTASYGTGDRAIARILVGFSKDVETDIQSQEGKLVVKVLGGAGGDAVALGTPPPGGQQVAATEGTGTTGNDATAANQRAQQDTQAQQEAAARSQKAAEEERKRQEAEAREAKRRAEEDRIAQEKAAKEAAQKAEQDRIAQEKAAKESARAAAEEEKKRKAEEAKAAAEEKRQQQEDAKAAAAEEKKRKAEEAKAAAEEKKRQQQEAQAAAAEEKKRKAEEARSAAEEKRRQQQEAKAAAAEEKKRKAEEAAEAKRRAAEEKANRGKRVAMAEPERTPQPRSEGGPVTVSPRRKTITFLGFRQEAGSSRVYVRTNEPVRYTVSPGGKNSVVLQLDNTHFGQSNTRRPLDTSYFDTAVAKVTSGESGKTARIEITLKENVPYEAHQDGNEVFLEFQRPGRGR